MFLSEETPFTVEDASGPGALTSADTKGCVSWRTTSISVIPRLSLVITVNSSVVFEPVQISPGEVGLITFGPTVMGFAPGRLQVAVRFRPVDHDTLAGRVPTEVELFSYRMDAFDAQEPWVEKQFELDSVAGMVGSFVVACISAPGVSSKEGELGLYEFVVGVEETLELNRARAFKQLRMRNEKANFDAYYQNVIFQSDDQYLIFQSDEQNAPANPQGADPSESRRAHIGPGRRLANLFKRFGRAIAGDRNTIAASSSRPEGEEQSASPDSTGAKDNAFSYSHSLLVEKLGISPPSFGWRLQTKLNEFIADRGVNGNSKLRVLSLCGGAARIEAGLIGGLPGDHLELTLLDLNPDLLNTAKRRLSELCEVNCLLGDVNELDLQGDRFDIILCVSGLHHVVEMEHLIEGVAKGLADKGEFWSIGENIGRNGGRLWPDSYEVANTFFSKLDKKYRVNRMTGLVVDECLQDLDYSIGCFEGIRCESIEPNLLNYLSPIDVCKHNCIVWKLFSPTYSDNYDMGRPEDVALIHEAIDLDIGLLRRGGRPIELNGVYGLPR